MTLDESRPDGIKAMPDIEQPGNGTSSSTIGSYRPEAAPHSLEFLEIANMGKLSVITVEPYSPGDDSASVKLSSGKGEVVAFCWPCSLGVGDVVENRLSTLGGNARAAYLPDWPSHEIEALSSELLEHTGNYSYKGRGRVLDASDGLIEVNGFVIELSGVMDVDYVDFEILRLDVGV